MSKLNSTIRIALSAVVFASVALPHIALAQGKGKGDDKGKREEKKIEKAEKAEVKRVDKIQKAEVKRVDRINKDEVKRVDKIQKAEVKQARKHVTTLQGVTVTREVLLANGYQVVNVVPSGTSRIIYYRRGNMGQGRGLGPVQSIVVVPAGEIVQFQSVPEPLLATILRRLGL